MAAGGMRATGLDLIDPGPSLVFWAEPLTWTLDARHGVTDAAPGWRATTRTGTVRRAGSSVRRGSWSRLMCQPTSGTTTRSGMHFEAAIWAGLSGPTAATRSMVGNHCHRTSWPAG